MALNPHMAAAVLEIDADIKLLKQERPKTCAHAARTRGEIKRLNAARATIDALYGGPEPKATEVRYTWPAGAGPKHGYVHGGHALAVAAALPEPLTAVALAWASVFSAAAASKCLKRWQADGWVKKVRHGQYVRTAKFPATVIPVA